MTPKEIREELIKILQNEDKYPNLEKECLTLHKLLKALLSVAVNPGIITKFKYQKGIRIFKNDLKDIDIRIKDDKCTLPQKLKEKELRKLIDFYYDLLEPYQNKRKSIFEKSEKAQSNQSKDLEKEDTKKLENKLPDKIEDPIKGDTKKPENKLPDKKEDPIYLDLNLDPIEDPNSSMNPENLSSIILADAFAQGVNTGPTSLNPENLSSIILADAFAQGVSIEPTSIVSNQENGDSIGLDPNISISAFINDVELNPPELSLYENEREEFFSCIPISNDNKRNNDNGIGASSNINISNSKNENVGNNERTEILFDDDKDKIDLEKLDKTLFICKKCQEQNYGFRCAKCNEEDEERKKVLKPIYDTINVPETNNESFLKSRFLNFRKYMHNFYS